MNGREERRVVTRLPDRREFVAVGVGALAVAVLPPALRSRRRRLVRRTVPVMGTLAEISVVHHDPGYAHRAIDAAVAELVRVDRTMSRFRDDSDVGRANREAARRPVPVTRETAAVVREALRWAERSGGRFDPCLGRAVALWDVAHRREPPPAEAVRAFAGRGLFRALEVGERRGRPVLLFRDPDVALDLGGIGKGYGVDRAVDALRARGVFHGFVNAGGDLYALGSSEDGDPWRVGIRNPERPETIIATVEVSDAAVATSGDYLQYFRYRGRLYHHLLDPETGEPRRGAVRSLTVRASTCTAADAAATAAFGLPRARAEALVAREPGAAVLHAV